MADRPTPGNDRIRGSNLADNIDALAGNDTIFGLAGEDTLSGGAGNDEVFGGADRDIIDAGNDDKDAFNKLFGNEGNDRITGSLGIDNIFGGEDNDLLLGKENNDFLQGQEGNDFLRGGAGNDAMTGDDGNDTLEGADFFFGDSGKGQIDSLSGNLGNDRFILGNFNGFGLGRALYDDGDPTTRGTDDFAIINDFGRGRDVIQLTGRFDYILADIDVRGETGVGIFIDNSAGVSDELIGIISDKIIDNEVSDLQITGSRTTKSIIRTS